MSNWPIKILHLGLGRFHRAHQAVYYQKLFNQQTKAWGVVAFSMRSDKAAREFNTVANRYPVIEFAKEHAQVTWIEAIREAYFAIEDFARLMQFFSMSEIEMVSLTITEKAYAVGALKQQQSAIGMLFLGLQHRKKVLNKPLTILSCDNLRANGNTLKKIILDYATLLGADDTKAWIDQYVSFPNSMVDRIVPALTSERRVELQEKFAISNPLILATESFSQWVIEDNFKTERPPLDAVGVQFVPDVHAFEDIKLRLLNAAHSLIAYSGIAKNHVYVHEAIRDPEILAEVSGLFTEVIPFLKLPSGFDIKNYLDLIIKRFDNPLLPHALKQIAMDGSQKLPQRIFPSLETAQQNHALHYYLSLTFDYWAKYCHAQNVEDPLKNEILALKQTGCSFDQFKQELYKIISLSN